MSELHQEPESVAEQTTFRQLERAVSLAQRCADATGDPWYVYKVRATGDLIVIQLENTHIDGRRLLQMWGPAEPQKSE